MRLFPFVFFTFVTFLSFSHTCWAHSVHVFAFVDGEEIQVECGFSKKKKVRHGKLIVTDLATGAVIHEGITDEQGVYRFRPKDEFLATGHGLNIRLLAGEGHQDDWEMSVEDLRTLTPVAPASIPEIKTDISLETPSTERPPLLLIQDVPHGHAGNFAAPPISEQEAMIGRVMDAKLSPIKQVLARTENRDPDLRDIIGGIGWILGLLEIGRAHV